MTERPEIIAGLRNAVERGYSLNQAVQSFINSGYNRQDVLDSARNLNEAVISRIPITPPEVKQPERPETISALHSFQTQQLIKQPISNITVQAQKPKTERKSKIGWIILLSGLLLILVVFLLIFIFAKEQILDFFSKLGF